MDQVNAVLAECDVLHGFAVAASTSPLPYVKPVVNPAVRCISQRCVVMIVLFELFACSGERWSYGLEAVWVSIV